MGTKPDLTRRRRLASACLASMLVVLALASFVTPSHATGGVAVSISGFAFHPATITVVIGVNNTVTWTNNDATSHTVTSDNSLFGSGTLAPGATYTQTFDQAGTYGYHCSIHPTMKGTVHAVSQTTTATSSSRSISTPPSTSTSNSVSSSSSSTLSSGVGSGTGIPEFPVQFGFTLLATVVIVASYVLARRVPVSRL
ncbi:MAG: cupredoxin domain-containing protein [Nitrososphaerales archaeon]